MRAPADTQQQDQTSRITISTPAPETCCSLTYVLPVHVVVEGEAVSGVVGDGGGRGRALGVHVEGGRQQPGLVSVQPRPRRLDVHVETCEIIRAEPGQRSAQGPHTAWCHTSAPQFDETQTNRTSRSGSNCLPELLRDLNL